MAIFRETSGDAPADDTTQYTVAAGDSFYGTIEAEYARDWVGIDLVAGQRIVVTLQGDPSGTFPLSDPYLRLFNAAGNQLRYNDDFDGLNSQITFTAAVNATFYLAAGGFGGNQGDYVMAVTGTTPVPPPGPGILISGTPDDDSLTGTPDNDTIEGDAGHLAPRDGVEGSAPDQHTVQYFEMYGSRFRAGKK